MPEIVVIGGGLAGSEAAWQAATRGCRVTLYEMKPQRFSPAHSSPLLAELVCSNSLRASDIESAVGLLKQASYAKFNESVDIAVKLSGDRALSVREKTELSVAMENLLGVDRADVILLSEADPFLAVNIIRGERVYAEDDYLADEYELYVLRRAGDLAELERERMALILQEA